MNAPGAGSRRTEGPDPGDRPHAPEGWPHCGNPACRQSRWVLQRNRDHGHAFITPKPSGRRMRSQFSSSLPSLMPGVPAPGFPFQPRPWGVIASEGALVRIYHPMAETSTLRERVRLHPLSRSRLRRLGGGEGQSDAMKNISFNSYSCCTLAMRNA